MKHEVSKHTGRVAWLAALLAVALLLGAHNSASAQEVTLTSPGDIGLSGTYGLCGVDTDLSNADYLLFNGNYKAMLYEYGYYEPNCWNYTVPIVSPPTDVNGPAVVVMKNGSQVPAGDFVAGTGVFYRYAFMTRLTDGYYLVLDGPYMGTATSVSLDGASAQFQTAGPFRLLIRLPEEIQALESLPYETYEFDVAITTPYGDYDESPMSVAPENRGVINLIPPGSPGSFSVASIDNDTSPVYTVGTYRTLNGATAGYEEFLASHILHLDFGQSTPESLYKHVTSDPELSAPNTLRSRGQFTGSGGNLIDFTVTSWLEPYNQQYYMSVAFTATTGTLGTIKLRPRMDEDVWDLGTDMSAFVGDSSTAANFVVMTPDKNARVGFGLKGFYTPSPRRLVNARYEGFVTAYYYALDRWIQGRTAVFSTTLSTGGVPGATIDTDGCLTEQAEAGWLTDKVYLDQSGCDVGVAMSWFANPNTTNAIITHMLYNVASDPTLAGGEVGLSGVELSDSSGAPVVLAPAFVSSTTSYSGSVDNATASVIVTPTLVDPNAVVSAVQVISGGGAVACSAAPFTCPLAVGDNRIEVIIFSSNFSANGVYSFDIWRELPPGWLDLELAGNGTPVALSPAFTTSVTAYTATVASTVASVRVTPTIGLAGVRLAGVEVSQNGGAPQSCLDPQTDLLDCPLASGANVITVTTQVGATGQPQYVVVTITRATDASLLNLAISPGVLAPAFVSSTLNYTTASASNATAAMLVTPTLQAGDTVSVTVAQNGGAAAACTGDPLSCPLAVGENVITVTVTAADGATQEYTVAVMRASDASLGGLQVSPGVLSPGFVSSTLNYTAAAVSNATATMLVTPTLQAGDTVSVTVAANGETATGCNGDPFACPLAVGENVITVTVTAVDGTTQEYTVTVVRASDATLDGLEVSPGVLSPGFVSSTLNYTTPVVGNAVANQLVTPTLQVGDTASVEVAANGGAASACTGDPLSCPLAVGENVITVTVTAADGTQQSYTVTTMRASDATLGGLEVSPGTLAPSFAGSTMDYTAEVDNATSAVLVTPTLQAGDTVSIEVAANGGEPAACTGDPVSCPLEVGTNVITVTVTAADGTTKSYTVTVTRAASSDATLSSLAINPGALSPAFEPSVTEYSAEVGNLVDAVSVTAVANDPGASITSVAVAQNGGEPVACTTDPISCPLAVGTNVITVTVTAADGTTKSYTVTIVRAAPDASDATLSSLALNGSAGAVPLAPAFDLAVTGYTASVGNSESAVTVAAVVNDAGASVTSVTVAQNGGAAVACTGDPVSCPLAVGTNVITVTVMAADGTTKTYTITIVRAAPDASDATLSSLALNGSAGAVPLAPAFDGSITGYTASVGNSESAVTVAAVVNDVGASVTSVTVAQNGGAAVACTGDPISCPLAVGTNVITVTVTAADGTTPSYTVTVTRDAPVVSSDASLSSLAINPGTLSPAFGAAIMQYTAAVDANVDAVGVTAAANDPGASVTSVTVAQNGGAPVACTGDPVSCPLAVGTNVIMVTVTAADGTTQSYTITITRAAPPAVVAVNDAAGVLEGESVVIAPLTNDLDPAAGGLLVAAVTDPANGTAVVNGDGRTVTYTPDAGFKGLDNFRYTAQDANGATSEAVVSIVVTAKGESAPPQVTPVDPTTTTTATFTTATGGVNIVVPPGAYDGSQGPLGPTDIFYIAFTEIVTPTSNVETPPGTLSFGGKIFTLEAFFNNIKLDKYVFPQPVTFTIGYDPAQINDLDPESLLLYYWDAGSQQWSSDGLTFVSRDTVNHTITYQVAHFTEFAYFGAAVVTLMNTYFPWLPVMAP